MYLPDTAMPYLSTALKVPSFENPIVAVFPTSFHFPIRSGFDAQNQRKESTMTGKRTRATRLNSPLFIRSFPSFGDIKNKLYDCTVFVCNRNYDI
jgi:hypothetical protein